jgi:biopolymer transport protein ExbB/TolQ
VEKEGRVTGRLVEILFVITNVLLAPVLVILVAMTAATLWMAGGLAREALDRGRSRAGWRDFLSGLAAGRAGAAAFLRLSLSGYPARLQAWLRDSSSTTTGPGPGPGAKKYLDDLELDITRRLSRLSFATRVGPMLGLVGTLLPLGPALRGLASDDLATLADHLEVAFTMTVFGLLIGGLAYAASILRRNWYEQDLSDLEFLLETMQRADGRGREDADDLVPVPEPESAHA